MAVFPITPECLITYFESVLGMLYFPTWDGPRLKHKSVSARLDPFQANRQDNGLDQIHFRLTDKTTGIKVGLPCNGFVITHIDDILNHS